MTNRAERRRAQKRLHTDRNKTLRSHAALYGRHVLLKINLIARSCHHLRQQLTLAVRCQAPGGSGQPLLRCSIKCQQSS